ncbi:MAG: DUF3253 domain-containing protein [Kiloniellales bacterium]|nr:DUF3253 domain-containing protein [Kiloniellales bacterium]
MVETSNEVQDRTGEPDSTPDDPVATAILALLAERGAGKSICPTEAARAFAETKARPSDPPDLWRRYLSATRHQALHLARAGRLRILRKGKPVDPHKPVKGVIRLALPESEAGEAERD